MIRFLILCIAFFILYVGFIFIGQYDTKLSLFVSHYQIETTLFLAIALFCVTQLFFTVFLKLLFSILNLPFYLKKGWERKKLKRVNQGLLEILSEFLIGRRQRAITLANKLLPSLQEQDMENLIAAEMWQNKEDKIPYYRNLAKSKIFQTYGYKKLAEIFYQNKQYTEGQECAIKAFNQDDADTEIMIILIRIYSALGLWSKLFLLVAKLQRSDKILFDKYAQEIAFYYYEAAKHYLTIEEDDEAEKYLESALEFKPDYIEALALYIKILENNKIHSGNNNEVISRLLRAAFSIRPCFEIAKMFADNSNEQAAAIYKELAQIAEPQKHTGLFLAIAAYLDLPAQIDKIKNIFTVI